MQDYLQRTRLAGRMDEAGGTLVLLAGSVLFFLLLWGVRIAALLAGIAAFALLMLLRARTRERRLQSREVRLRRQIGGEMKLEAWTLCPPRRAHSEAALLVMEALGGQMVRVLDTGMLCCVQGKQTLLACAQLPAGEKLTARDIAAFQRACLDAGAEAGVLCGADGLTEGAKRQSFLAPSVHALSRARMIALAGAAFPATDAQLVALGKRKRRAGQAKTALRRMLEPHRARQYLLYGLMLCGLYILTGQRFYPLPGAACLMLMALCRALPTQERAFLEV